MIKSVFEAYAAGYRESKKFSAEPGLKEQKSKNP
jgi:hypothetical protein